ncbi:MAG: dihydropteroate synthase [Vicinamibacterales bacterium]
MSIVAPRARFELPLPGRAPLTLGARTLVMAVVNVTPDSFSDGGTSLDPERALAHALELEAEGADLLDVGAESTRPGSAGVDEAEELARIVPVLDRLAKAVRIPISVDTTKAAVAERALGAGACLVNDVSALGYNRDLGAIVARHGAALVLMHMRGRPRDMYREARYDDVAADVARELSDAVARALAAGVDPARLVLDPGLGFAKQPRHSYAALAGLDRLAALGRPLLVGPSRKSFLADAAGGAPPTGRDWATAGAVAAAVLGGAHIVRVHRVAGLADTVRAADAVRAAAEERA